MVLGLAVLLAAGVNSLAAWMTEHGHRSRGLVIAIAVGVLVIVNLPALWNGTFYGKNLQRPEDIPSYWTDAAKHLDAQSHDTRVLELPGADFASYRWGNTVDPITPGLIDRPFVARELIPYGSPASANLLNVFDLRIQDRQMPSGGDRTDGPADERGRHRPAQRPAVRAVPGDPARVPVAAVQPAARRSR